LNVGGSVSYNFEQSSGEDKTYQRVGSLLMKINAATSLCWSGDQFCGPLIRTQSDVELLRWCQTHSFFYPAFDTNG
jgi:hypothetical protein